MRSRRNANVEFLRLISMVMIITMHGLQEPGALYLYSIFGDIYRFIKALSIVAVNIFILITGYFGFENFKFKTSSLLHLAGLTWLYSICTFLINTISGSIEFSKIGLVQALFPITTKQFWFVNVYIGLYIMIPFLNKMLHQIQNSRCIDLLTIVVITLFSIRPTFFPATWCLETSGGYGIIWFVTIYIVSVWLKYRAPKLNIQIYVIGYFVCAILVVISNSLIRTYIGVKYAEKFYCYNNLIVLIESICLFMYFIRLNEMPEKIGGFICRISKSVFSIYILHYSVNSLLWTRWLGFSSTNLNSVLGFVCFGLAVLSVMIICILIDTVRNRFMKWIFFKLRNNKFIKKIYRIETKIDLLFETAV